MKIAKNSIWGELFIKNRIETFWNQAMLNSVDYKSSNIDIKKGESSVIQSQIPSLVKTILEKSRKP